MNEIHAITIRCAICILFVASIGNLTAQVDLNKAVNFQNTEVLESTDIKRMVEGPYGFIWIATADGLFRFDGSMLQLIFEGHFEDIDIDEVSHHFIFTSRDKIILYSFSGEQLKIIAKDSLLVGDYLLQATIIVNDSSYWIASTYGITRYHTKTGETKAIQIFDPENRRVAITVIALDPFDKAKLWLGSKTGLYAFNVDTYEYVRHWLTSSRRKERELALNNIDALYLSKDGKVYCGSWGAGLAIYDPLTGDIDHFNHELGNRDNPHVYAITPDTDSTIWIAATTGAGNYNIKTGEMASYKYSTILDDPVLDIGPVMKDKKGKYWIGYANGLRMLDPNRSHIEIINCPVMTSDKFYITRSVTSGRNPELLYLAVDFSDGLYTFNLADRDWNCIKVKDAEPNWEFRPWQTLWQGDTLWIVHNHGLYYYKEGEQFLTEHPLETDQTHYRFRSFTRVANDEIWLASDLRGLYVLDFKSGELHHFSEITAFSEYDFLSVVTEIHVDHEGRVWLCSKNQLHVYLPIESRFVDLSSRVNNGQPFLDIYSISEKNNHIWISTGTGIYMMKHGNGDEYQSAKVSGITSSNLVSDGNEHLWIVAGQSLVRLNWQSGSSQTFTESAGLPRKGHSDFDRIDIIGEDQLLLSTRKTYALFRPTDLNTTPEPPVPYFVSVSVDGIERHVTGLGLSLSYLSIEPDENSLAIDFSAISYTSQINNRFRYKLEGVNDAWVTGAADSKGPTYVNLDAGEYRFLVEVAGVDEQWSPPAILEIKVGEFWWQYIWVHAILVLAALGFLVAIYQVRLSRVRRNSELQLHIMDLEKKALQAQMNPHFIFNAMNSIQHFMASKDEKNAMFYLNRFSKLLRAILESSHKSFVNLESELEMLENYILLESLRFEDAFKYEIVVAPSLAHTDIKIPGFVIQPVVENAIKHGLLPKNKGGDLKITLRQSDNMVNCIVEDNGVGRSQNGSIRSNGDRISMGLKILRTRLNLYNPGSVKEMIVIKDLYSDDGSPSGTRVEIDLPIQPV